MLVEMDKQDGLKIKIWYFYILGFLCAKFPGKESDPQNQNYWFQMLAQHQNHTCSLKKKKKMVMPSPHSRPIKENV